MDERTRELLTLILGDTVVFIGALYITLVLRYWRLPDWPLIEVHLGPFLLLATIWLFIFYVSGLYDKHTSFLKSLVVSRIIYAQIINVIIAAVLFILLPFGITPKTNLVIYLLVSVLLVTAWRLYIFPQIQPQGKQRAILLADGADAIELVDEVNNNNRYTYRFIRIIDRQTAESTPDFRAKLNALLAKERVDIIVADAHNPYIEEVVSQLFKMSFLDFRFTFLDFHRVYEHTFDRVSLSALRYDWFLAHVSQSKHLFFDVVKRFIDILGSIILGIGFLLVLPVIAIAIYIEDKGSVFIAQKRLGQYRRLITVYKLRTMSENRSVSGTWTAEDAQEGNHITRVGAVLRKTSIDELPQIWNILKGEMSLIGPRNDTVGLAERLAEDIPYYDIRYFVRPGVTGWAQTNQQYQEGNISPQSLAETKLRFSYDLYYVKNKSLLLDIAIALKTIKTLLSRFSPRLFLFKRNTVKTDSI